MSTMLGALVLSSPSVAPENLMMLCCRPEETMRLRMGRMFRQDCTTVALLLN